MVSIKDLLLFLRKSFADYSGIELVKLAYQNTQSDYSTTVTPLFKKEVKFVFESKLKFRPLS